MCKSGCYNEDCWGDCTVSLNYCEVEKVNKINELRKQIKTYIEALELLKEYDEAYDWITNEIDKIEDQIKYYIETEEEKEYRLEREEENRER